MRTPSVAIPPSAAGYRRALAWVLTAALGAAGAVGLTVQERALAQARVQATAQATPQAQTNAGTPAGPAAGSAGTAPPSPALNPNPVPASVMAHTCAACHGTNGQLGDEAFKPLAGMPVQQFVRTMIDFREGRRPATLMGHVAKGFTDADLQAMGEFFAAVAPLVDGTATHKATP